MAQIKVLKGREVLDSRGNPTVEVDLVTEDGLFRAMVASGASAGVHEALELRDGGGRYLGKGVQKAVDNVNKVVAPKMVGVDVSDQKNVDKILCELDGTKTKQKLGANAILPVSMAACRAAAKAQGLWDYEYMGKLAGMKPDTLPIPQLNVINGGKHAGMENDPQEHMIMPVGAKSFAEALRMAAETYHHLGKLLKKEFGARGKLVGDEGGFVPPITNVAGRLEAMTKAVEAAGYTTKQIKFALDPAASEFFENGIYTVGDKRMSSGEIIGYYADLVSTYPIVSIEDGMAEDDWDGFVEMTKRMGDKVQIVGDDLLVTNTDRIGKAIQMKAANSVLIKLNQIGTVTETLDAVKIAYKAGWTAVVSHRSGETEDPFIADLVVGVNGGQSKFGAPARSDRNCKYNQLLRIEENLGGKAKYAGKEW